MITSTPIVQTYEDAIPPQAPVAQPPHHPTPKSPVPRINLGRFPLPGMNLGSRPNSVRPIYESSVEACCPIQHLQTTNHPATAPISEDQSLRRDSFSAKRYGHCRSMTQWVGFEDVCTTAIEWSLWIYGVADRYFSLNKPVKNS